MKKIVWLSNVSFSKELIRATGGWLQPLAMKLNHTGSFKMYNLALGNKAEEYDVDGISQIVILKKSNKALSLEVKSILDKIKPDLVHIWGTEGIWAAIYKNGFISFKTIIDIQGLLFAYTQFYYGGLSYLEIFKTITIKELIMPNRILTQRKNKFRERGYEEVEALKCFKHISYQSIWVKNHVQYINPKANLYATKILLRDSFYSSPKWKFKKNKDSPVIFSSSSAAVSYKGIHVLIKATKFLKRQYPNVKLRLAGNLMVGNKMIDGYSLFLKSLVDKNDLKDNVFYTGSLSEKEIVKELLACDVCVVPSFVETYCLAFAEAMILGVPVVASYAGAMPELAQDRKEALFYNSRDVVACASMIAQLIEDEKLASDISKYAIKRRELENAPELVLENQIQIYNQLI